MGPQGAGGSMKFRALSILIFVAVNLPWSAGAFTREEVVCPISEDWFEGATWCPCEYDWKPTEEQLQGILEAHKAWLKQEGWKNPTVSGQAILCKANLDRAELIRANLQRANLRYASLRRASLQSANLEGADLFNANLIGAFLNKAVLRKAILQQAFLQGAHLGGADLQAAKLVLADFEGARLYYANLKKAVMLDTNLTKSGLVGADLSEADLERSSLVEADLRRSKVDKAIFLRADLSNSIYAPTSLPPSGYLEGIEGLWTVTFGPGEQSGLVQLRELLQKSGLRDLEREATFAIEKNKALHARESGSTFAWIGGWCQLVFFEWTTGWGLYPSRALAIMLGVMAGITLIYAVPISLLSSSASNRSGVIRVWPADRAKETSDGFVPAGEEQMERLTVHGPRVFLWAFYFSMLSAFHIGWRDLNVGTWITRIQPTEFALRGRRWVRVFSGFQSLISVYLVAMWVLTYFGRPFQ